VVSVRRREQLRDTTGDPWDGLTLEWSTSSPPPEWNFVRLPCVDDLYPWWKAKREGGGRLEYAPAEGNLLHVPRNSPLGFFVAAFASVAGFALVWHIGWLALLGLAGIIACVLVQAWSLDRERMVPAEADGAAS